MFPTWLLNHLDANPYPSLSFLPLTLSENGKEEIVFFYQHNKHELELLSGNIKVDFTFYEEPNAHIMSFNFYPETITELETPQFRLRQEEKSTLYCETEFCKNDLHHTALKQLAEQDTITLFLYDKHSLHSKQKHISFELFSPALKDYLLSQNIT